MKKYIRVNQYIAVIFCAYFCVIKKIFNIFGYKLRRCSQIDLDEEYSIPYDKDLESNMIYKKDYNQYRLNVQTNCDGHISKIYGWY